MSKTRLFKKNAKNSRDVDAHDLSASHLMSIPILSTAERNNLPTDQPGLLIWNTTDNEYQILNGAATWNVVTTSGSGTATFDNINLNAGGEYRINTQAVLKQNHVLENSTDSNFNNNMRLTSTGLRVGDTNAPTSLLHLNATNPTIQVEGTGISSIQMRGASENIIDMGFNNVDLQMATGTGDLDIRQSSQNVVKISTSTGDRIMSVGRGLGQPLDKLAMIISGGASEDHGLLVPNMSNLGQTAFSAAASAPQYNGTIWYNNTDHELRAYINGTIHDIHGAHTTDITHVNTSDASSQLVGKDDPLTLTNKNIQLTSASPSTSFVDSTEVYSFVRKASTGSIPANSLVYPVSFNVGANIAEVELSSNTSPSTAPGYFVVDPITNTQGGRILLIGRLQNVNCTGFSVGDIVYLGVSGAFTNVKPTGANVIIQEVGICLKQGGSGAIGVIGGHPADLPQLSGTSHIWLSDSNGSPVSTQNNTVNVTLSDTQTMTAKKTISLLGAGDVFDLLTVQNERTINGASAGIQFKARNGATNHNKSIYVDGYQGVGGTDGGLCMFNVDDGDYMMCVNNNTIGVSGAYHINLNGANSEYRINGTSVLNGSTLGSGVTSSSLTSLGTLTSGLNIASGQAYKINGVNIVTSTALASSITSAPGLSLTGGVNHASPFYIQTTSDTDVVCRWDRNNGASIWELNLKSSGMNFVNSSTDWVRITANGLTLPQTGQFVEINGNQIIQSRESGTYGTWTGTPNKTTAYNVTTVTLQQLAERVAAIQTTLVHHGLSA